MAAGGVVVLTHLVEELSLVFGFLLLGLPELTVISKAKFTLLSSAVPSSKEIRKRRKNISIFRRKEAVSVYNRH